jgi:DNA-binding winged helix-turn-helix (wHTH) protein/TolB-like protein
MPKFQLGDWLVDPEGGTFQQGEHTLRVEPKVMDVLVRLAKSGGEVVSREDLLESVWANVVVSEEALTRCISELRTLLGDTGRQRRYIRTVPKRGYALMMDVCWLDKPASQAHLPGHDRQFAEEPGYGGTLIARNSQPSFWVYAAVIAVAALCYAIFQAYGPTLQFSGSNKPASPIIVEAEAGRLSRIIADDSRPSLAVLPFSNLSPASEHRFAAEALTEDLRSDLTRTNALRVAARTSSLAFRDQALDIREIGELLNVEHLVEGSVRMEGENLRITVQLTDAYTGYQVWSQVFERPQQKMRGLDIEIAESLVAQIVPPEISAKITKTETSTDSEAYGQYLLGRYYSYQNTSESETKAITHYQAAIDRDESFGLAYGGLAQLYMDRLSINNKKHWHKPVEPSEKLRVMAQVEPLLSKAVHLEPNSGEVLAASARYASLQGEVDQAIDTYQLALNTNPAMPMARLALGKLFLRKDEVNLAFQQYSVALQTDPLHPNIQQGFVWGLMSKGEYVDAIRYAEQFFEQSKNEDLLKVALKSYVWTGQYDKALSFAQAFNFSPELEKIATFHVVESLYFLQRFKDADKLRQQSEQMFDASSQAHLEVNKGVSLRDANIVYRAADMLIDAEPMMAKDGLDCLKPYEKYWRAYGAYIERDYESAINYFEESENSGFDECLESPDLQVSFSLYFSHSLQLVGDERATQRLQFAARQLNSYSDRGWGGSRLSLYKIALNLLNSNYGEANDELIRLRAKEIEPFGMIFAEPIFDNFYGNDQIEPTMNLVRLDFEETRERCNDQQLVKFGL